ncbi:MAG: class I SAM-dependent methyltransferase [Chitinophagaceae bacterium]|nr:MAG: class I SAM-dependent methyltransferase [Chitinophagaceae bacterium]
MRFSEYVYKTYHRILLEQLIAKHAYHINGTMLDIGALNPRYNHLFKATVTSVDIIVNEKLGVLYGDIEQGLSFADDSFDSVICIEVFEYLDDYQRAINEIYRLLKPSGRAFISVPFFYRDHTDNIRFTEKMLRAKLQQFRSVQSIRIGNGYIAVWDILKKKIFGIKFKLLRYFFFILFLPYLGLLKLFKVARIKDDFYTGLFMIIEK